MKFEDLDLRPEILAGLREMDYTELTPVQEQTLEPILAGRDLIARAETGSGKTSACAVPLVQCVDEQLKEVQGLIMVPTRELALQYVTEIAAVAKRTGVAPFAVYGGFDMGIQKSKLQHGVHILVATPGRLIDLLRNSPLRLADVRTLVLDEADEMMKMGFIDDVEFIISCLIHEHQTLLFSATMPREIKDLSRKYLKEPVTVELNVNQVTPQNLEHRFEMVSPQRHFDTLVAYLKEEEPTQAILFCNSRNSAEKLAGQLGKQLKSVGLIHGGLEQDRRTSLFNRFKKLDIQFMVATDVASRGLDFSHVTHVINYDFPMSVDAYTHRTGRTARMGRRGVATTFVTSRSLGKLRQVLRANRIEPVWRGNEPDMSKAGSGKGSGGSRRGRGGRGGGQRGGHSRGARRRK